MRFFLPCVLKLFLISASATRRYPNIISDTLIDDINSLETTWKAGHNAHVVPSIRLSYSLDNHTAEEDWSILPFVSDVELNLPAEFDSRLQWPYCPSIREIWDQASCGCCWAMSAVTAMTDRQCIHSQGKLQFQYSTTNLVNCCHQCGKGCHGGSHREAWKYWVEFGIVSGGPYDSEEGCQPYEFPPCEHHMKGPRPNCTKYGPTPKCKNVCQPKYNTSYKEDLHFGKSTYSIIRNESAIRTEIYRNGPVQTSFRMHTDFYAYKSGVYQHVKGEFIDYHAVKIIGWGTDNVTNTPYWTVANTFNYDWGDGGFFLIKRGTDECGIEDDVTAGIPMLGNNKSENPGVQTNRSHRFQLCKLTDLVLFFSLTYHLLRKQESDFHFITRE